MEINNRVSRCLHLDILFVWLFPAIFHFFGTGIVFVLNIYRNLRISPDIHSLFYKLPPRDRKGAREHLSLGVSRKDITAEFSLLRVSEGKNTSSLWSILFFVGAFTQLVETARQSKIYTLPKTFATHPPPQLLRRRFFFPYEKPSPLWGSNFPKGFGRVRSWYSSSFTIKSQRVIFSEMRLNFSVLQFLRDTVGSNWALSGVWKTCGVGTSKRSTVALGSLGCIRKFGIHEQQNMLTIQTAEFLMFQHLTIDGLDVPWLQAIMGCSLALFSWMPSMPKRCMRVRPSDQSRS